MWLQHIIVALSKLLIQIPEIKLLKQNKKKQTTELQALRRIIQLFPQVSAQGRGSSSIYLRVCMFPEKETITLIKIKVANE